MKSRRAVTQENPVWQAIRSASPALLPVCDQTFRSMHCYSYCVLEALGMMIHVTAVLMTSCALQDSTPQHINKYNQWTKSRFSCLQCKFKHTCCLNQVATVTQWAKCITSQSLHRKEAAKDAAQEPILSSFLYASVLSHDSFEMALAAILANRLSDPTMMATELIDIFHR